MMTKVWLIRLLLTCCLTWHNAECYEYPSDERVGDELISRPFPEFRQSGNMRTILLTDQPLQVKGHLVGFQVYSEIAGEVTLNVWRSAAVGYFTPDTDPRYRKWVDSNMTSSVGSTEFTLVGGADHVAVPMMGTRTVFLDQMPVVLPGDVLGMSFLDNPVPYTTSGGHSPGCVHFMDQAPDTNLSTHEFFQLPVTCRNYSLQAIIDTTYPEAACPYFHISEINTMYTLKSQMDPNYINDYQFCWKIRAAGDDKTIKLEAESFRLETLDYLTLSYNGPDGVAYSPRFSGSSFPDLEIPSTSVVLNFTTDYSEVNTGFILKYYSQGQETTSSTTTAASTATSSATMFLPTAQTTTTSGNAQAAASTSDGGLDTWEWVLIGLAIAVGVLLIIALISCCCCWEKSPCYWHREKSNSTVMPTSDGPCVYPGPIKAPASAPTMARPSRRAHTLPPLYYGGENYRGGREFFVDVRALQDHPPPYTPESRSLSRQISNMSAYERWRDRAESRPSSSQRPAGLHRQKSMSEILDAYHEPAGHPRRMNKIDSQLTLSPHEEELCID